MPLISRITKEALVLIDRGKALVHSLQLGRNIRKTYSDLSVSEVLNEKADVLQMILETQGLRRIMITNTGKLVYARRLYNA
jgi:hypothetical protein